MGSRIMHYCISDIIADQVGFEDKTDFILGGIAPDIHGLMGVPKSVTHFKEKDEKGNVILTTSDFIKYIKR
ncbi:hypothetical protein VBD025_16005 [Virgibacillus flavescens]|uniref:hypothetical protein n=1 Tax=Virgibacillus flavescens TaxID=1611422 RepID=UPI003D32B059